YSGGSGSGSADAGEPSMAAKAIKAVLSKVANFAGADRLGFMGKLVGGAARKVLNGAVDYLFNNQSSGPDGFSGSVPAGQAQKIAKAMLGNYGWGDDQWGPLQKLWQKEASWNHRARNPSSGAYGIPQSLPASKMASAGSDWMTNPATQIKWGLGYIKGRYGNPAAAWAHSQRLNWYAKGTKRAKPGWA